MSFAATTSENSYHLEMAPVGPDNLSSFLLFFLFVLSIEQHVTVPCIIRLLLFDLLCQPWQIIASDSSFEGCCFLFTHCSLKMSYKSSASTCLAPRVVKIFNIKT